MNEEAIHVTDAKEAYDIIVEGCVADLKTAYGDEGRRTTCLCVACDDATTTDIEVSYDYSLGIDYDCDNNTYAIVSASVSVSSIEAATYDFDDDEVTTGFTRSIREIDERKLALDVERRLDLNYI